MKTIVTIIAAAIVLSGCAAKRYDSATQIESKTTITQDSTAPISLDAPVVPLAGQTMRQTVGTVSEVSSTTSDSKSLNGKKLVEVKFVRKDGGYSVLEVMATGERYKVKGTWGEVGDQFKIERP